MTKIKLAAIAFLMLAALPLSTLAQQGPAGAAAIPDGKFVSINTTMFPAQIGELKQKYALAQTAAAAAAIPDGKVVIVNTSVFPAQLGELKQKYELVQGQFKEREQRIEQLRQALAAKQSELESKGPGLTAEKVRDLTAEVEELKRRGTRELEDAQQDFSKALEVATKPVRDKVIQAMQNYAAQRGIIMIMDLAGLGQTGSLAYLAPGTDVTQDFVKEYNKANPVPTAAAPPATQPAARPAGPVKPPVK